MKKYFNKKTVIVAILIAIVAMFAVGQIVYDLKNALTFTSVIAPKITTAADTSAAIDVSPYVGKVILIQTICGSYGTSVSFTSKVQSSSDGTTFTSAPADSTFTTFTSFGDTTVGQIQYKSLDPRVIKRYLRYITTLSASDTVAYNVKMISQARSR